MGDPPPVPAAGNPIPPPLNNMPFTNPDTGRLTLMAVSFLTQFWAGMFGDAGLGPSVKFLKEQVALIEAELIVLTDAVAAIAGQVAIIFGMHGDGTLSGSGQLVVTSTEGVPFAPSATIDTTDADNITTGTLDILQLPLWLFQWSTINDLPDPSPGTGILCTDLGGGPGVLTGSGGYWQRTSPGFEFQEPAATLTLQVLTNAEEQYQASVLAANMVVSLSTTNAYPGARFRWLRAGAGAFTLVFKDQGSGATLYTSAAAATETMEFLYTGIAWILAQHSVL
jgi:hypothetical protein